MAHYNNKIIILTDLDSFNRITVIRYKDKGKASIGIILNRTEKGKNMRLRTIHRNDWLKITEKEEILQEFHWKGIPGIISLLDIKQVREPVYIQYETGKVKIVDVGYSWVQIALERQFFWITSMFDENNRLVEIYIDITDGNKTMTEDPCFTDLYLDYVVHIRDDTVLELDREELDSAFTAGKISREQYERTIQAGNKIYQYLQNDRSELINILIREQKRLKQLTAKTENSQ